jgi:hypothetical protein
MGERPSDRWVIPLCSRHHREQHERGDEKAWWGGELAFVGICAIAERLFLTRTHEAREEIVRANRD